MGSINQSRPRRERTQMRVHAIRLTLFKGSNERKPQTTRKSSPPRFPPADCEGIYTEKERMSNQKLESATKQRERWEIPTANVKQAGFETRNPDNVTYLHNVGVWLERSSPPTEAD
jgi:hypothetical protein